MTDNLIILKLRDARFPSFFTLVLSNGRRVVVPTIQSGPSKVMLTGEKSEETSEFEHAKACLVVCGQFDNELTLAQKQVILANKDQVGVGTISVVGVGKHNVIINNIAEEVILQPVEDN